MSQKQSKSENKKKEIVKKDSKLKKFITIWIPIISLLLSIYAIHQTNVIHNENINLTYKLNSLNREMSANDVLIYSYDYETERSLEPFNISVNLKSNYEIGILSKISKLEIYRDGEETNENILLFPISKNEQIVNGDDEVEYLYHIEPNQIGEYKLKFFFRYGYKQGNKYDLGKSETYELPFIVK